MRSLSEIETAVKRASRAVGFSWGVSEEVGKSIRLLELFGFVIIRIRKKVYNNTIPNPIKNIILLVISYFLL